MVVRRASRADGVAISEHTTDGPPVARRACRWTRSRESRDSRGISPPTIIVLLRCTYGVGWPRSSSSGCSSWARSKAWASQDVDAPLLFISSIQEPRGGGKRERGTEAPLVRALLRRSFATEACGRLGECCERRFGCGPRSVGGQAGRVFPPPSRRSSEREPEALRRRARGAAARGQRDKGARPLAAGAARAHPEALR
jgi:hypothetical protein